MPEKREDWSVLRSGPAYDTYKEGFKSVETLRLYDHNLIQFLTDPLVNRSFDDFIKLAKTNPEECQALITSYVLKQKRRVEASEIVASTLRSYVKSLAFALEMNDALGINWRKIKRILPEGSSSGSDRIPREEEIQKIDKHCDIREKFILSAMISGGFRVGGWTNLKVGDIEKIERDGQIIAAKVTIYRGTNDQYVTFISPEAWQRFQDYQQTRETAGEKITKNSPVLRNIFGVCGSVVVDVNKVEPLAVHGIEGAFRRVHQRAGVKHTEKGDHFKILHSYRKVFKTRCDLAGLNKSIVELLMGHSIGVGDSYLKPTENQLLEEYLKAVPQLAVDQANANETSTKNEIQELRDMIASLTKRINNLGD